MGDMFMKIQYKKKTYQQTDICCGECVFMECLSFEEYAYLNCVYRFPCNHKGFKKLFNSKIFKL